MIEQLYLDVEDMKIEVKVIGTRQVFGRDESEITPVSGSGSKWIWNERLLKSVNAKLIKKNV